MNNTVQQMKLADEYFEKIKNGKKTIECRLYDEKRKTLQIGDTIEFSNAQNGNDKISAKIVAFHTFPSFNELLDHFPITSFGAEDKKKFLEVLRKFYSKEKEEKYGVVGIEIELI